MFHKISIIIPVYNAEEYLYECLDSLINQTMKNTEIICIDDGSTDNSYEILSEYAAKDNRFIILQQENKGAGAARNKGMEIAKGEFLAFLDADDFFEHDMLEITLNKIEKTQADFVIFNSNQFDDKTKQFVDSDWFVIYDFFPNEETFNYSQISGNIFKSIVGWAWDKLYRTSFVKKHNLKFQEQRTTNDALFVFSALFLASKISLLKNDKKLVHHRINNSFSLENTRSKSWMCFYNMLIALKERLFKENKFNELEHDFINYALHFSIWNLNTLKEPIYSLLKEKLRNEWFESLGLTSKDESYFENKIEYQQMVLILNNDIYINSPLLFKDIGLGCNTCCPPITVTDNNNDTKSYTYDLSDNIYTRYISWDPIKEGSCNVEIIRLFAIEKRTKKIVEFPINKITSNGKIIGNKVEFRNQKGCWIGCTIEGAYESFTIEAEIKKQ
ncbi:MAG: glycosyltransferase family 2 protein [Spirochaetales bacterium]|nr:glycosyltransferase family 2 protein [Spirochaetales bacterium]